MSGTAQFLNTIPLNLPVMCPFYGTFQMRNFVTDIGTEELAHLEMVATIVHQLTRNLSMEQIEESGFRNYYVDHTIGIWPQAAGGVPFNACEFQSKGDIITDLTEDMAAEQKARSTYDNILRLVKDEPDVYEPIKFLRAREIVVTRTTAINTIPICCVRSIGTPTAIIDSSDQSNSLSLQFPSP